MPSCSPPHPILAVENLSVERSGVSILKDINWSVQRGENWAILGANGCGKTSLLGAIMLYLPPTRGSISLLGHSYGEADWSVLKKRIGMVSSSIARRVPADEHALETVLSGQSAQLGFWTHARKVDPSEALRALGMMGIRGLAERPWSVLSQGERQKVFIARALVNKPELLILDEPCAGLDPVARERFLQRIQQLGERKRGPSLILVTHHIEEIAPMITHVLLLRKGKVLQAGPKDSVLFSESMSKVYGRPVTVQQKRNGWWKMSLDF